jgi:Condensation domain
MDVSFASMPLARPLGSLEQMFWFKNRHMPYHFTVCAEIHGATTVAGWVKALGAVQRRHSAFGVAITRDDNGVLCFRQGATDNAISLRIVAGDGTGWEGEMEQQLSIPFNSEEAPLVRATLLHQAHRAFLIMAAHHSIADTKSLVFAIRDMLQVLAGHSLDPLPSVGSLDSLLPPFVIRSAETALAAEAFPSPGSLDVYRTNDGSPPRVKALELSPALTRELRRRSGMEETTVHGALVAAAVEAARQTSPELRAATINVGSAVDFRDSVAGGEGVALLSGGGSVLVSPERRGFWDLALDVASHQLKPRK